MASCRYYIRLTHSTLVMSLCNIHSRLPHHFVKRPAEGAMRTGTCSSSSTYFVVPVSTKCAGDKAFSVAVGNKAFLVVAPHTIVDHFTC